MVKIKQKKQLNLPQLIEWVWKSEKSDVKAKYFKCKEGNEIKHIIYAHPTGRLNLDSERFYDKNDLFTVEVEEEIDECSNIKRLAHYTVHGFTSTNFNKSIGELRKSNSLAFYSMNDDRTLTLIWTKEKGMVE